MGLIGKLKDRHAIKEYLSRGDKLQAEKNLEDAFEQFVKAADLGSTDAMMRIAKLYFSGQFRPKEESNLMELFLQGMPAFPWNTVNRTVPDYASALEWFRKAADLGDAAAACMAGSMLCDGTGCRKNKTAGLEYLKKAADAGLTEAHNILCLYRDHEKRSFTREQYEVKLRGFEYAAAAGQPEAYTLYDALMGGTPAQLARLGYILIKQKYAGCKAFEPFSHGVASSGIPLIPIASKRGAWRTFLRVDLNAFFTEDVYIAFSSDIDPDYTLGFSHRLVRCGNAVYRSPEFGWLREEKHAVLFRIDRNAHLSEEDLQTVVEQFCLIEEEYLPENAAFFTECGEKEYSVEVAAISGSKVDVLCRYTIGGSDVVHDYFEPELISLSEA